MADCDVFPAGAMWYKCKKFLVKVGMSHQNTETCEMKDEDADILKVIVWSETVTELSRTGAAYPIIT